MPGKKTKPSRSAVKSPATRPEPSVVIALREENERLLQRISLLETLCITAQNRIKALETELDPNAPEKLTGDELEAILQAVLETSGPVRRKRR
jgi:hypothetical protein